jgi:hypothetical protein
LTSGEELLTAKVGKKRLERWLVVGPGVKDFSWDLCGSFVNFAVQAFVSWLSRKS